MPLNKIILSLWVRLLATVLNFQPKRIGYAKNNVTHEGTCPKWDNLIILKKKSWHGAKIWEITSCSADWTTPANVSYQSGDFGSTQTSAQICTCSSCVTQSKGAIMPQSSICMIYPLPINYVFESEDNDPFVGVRSKRKFLLQVFPVSYSRVQSPGFFLFLAPGASILAWVFRASCDVLQPNWSVTLPRCGFPKSVISQSTINCSK